VHGPGLRLEAAVADCGGGLVRNASGHEGADGDCGEEAIREPEYGSIALT
jgi:hypothetical protein